MKILGISFGSRNGNNDAMCKQALMAAKENGADIEFINMQNLHIEHCTGCIACVQGIFSGKGNFCALKDDFGWLLDKMLDADGIVIAVPIFEKGATGLFRTITDRFGPRMDRGSNTIGAMIAKEHDGKEIDPRILQDRVISYMCIGGSDWATRVQCDTAMQALTPMWKVIDNEYFMWSKGIMMDDKKLARATRIGKNIAEAAADIENAQYQGEEGVCPHCHCRNFFLDNSSTKAICCLCGIEGELQIVNGTVKFVFPEEQIKHAHDTMSGKFIHCDDIQENEGKLAASKSTDEYKKRKKMYMEFIESSKPKR